MRNYDEIREKKAEELSFTLGGEQFSIHMLPVTYITIWTDREKDIDVSDMTAFTAMCVDRIADAVADGNGSETRWRELCKGEHAPSYGELLELARWVWEAQSDLPTMESAPSQPGRATTAVSSKGE